MTEEELDKKKSLKKRSRILKSVCVSLLAAGVIASLVLSSLAYVNSLNGSGSPGAAPSESGRKHHCTNQHSKHDEYHRAA